MKKQVCVVTGSRAEYGILRPLLRRIRQSDDMELVLVLTGSHLSAAFGNTQSEILEDGFDIAERVYLRSDTDTKAGMVAGTGEVMAAFGLYFSQHRPDIVVLLGDRYEIFAVAAAAAMLNLPIAHLHGGETTEGAVDEFLRHSITKMSALHFTACEAYRRRVIQLGENPSRVWNVGSLSVENALSIPFISKKALGDSLNVGLEESEFCVVTYHPVTLESDTAQAQVRALIRAIESFPRYRFIITKSNADAGGVSINALWDSEAAAHENWTVVSSLGATRYFSALRYAKAVIGNSSSGIIEAPAMKLPTVNIGDRQKGRVMAESVICCSADTASIAAAIGIALSPEFQAKAANVENPFGGAAISQTILQHIREFLAQDVYTGKKTFYDLS